MSVDLHDGSPRDESADQAVGVKDLCGALGRAKLPSDLRKVLQQQFVFTYNLLGTDARGPRSGVMTVRLENAGFTNGTLWLLVRGCTFQADSDADDFGERRWLMRWNSSTQKLVGWGMTGTLAPLP